MNAVRLHRQGCCKAQTSKLGYCGINNLKYQPCDCQDFPRIMHPQLPDKIKTKVVSDHIKLTRKNMRGKVYRLLQTRQGR